MYIDSIVRFDLFKLKQRNTHQPGSETHTVEHFLPEKKNIGVVHALLVNFSLKTDEFNKKYIIIGT